MDLSIRAVDQYRHASVMRDFLRVIQLFKPDVQRFCNLLGQTLVGFDRKVHVASA